MKKSNPKGAKSLLPTKKERVRLCIDLMCSGQWVSGVTGPGLAEQWGCNERTITADSAEASRYIRERVVNSDELRSRLSSTLETITSMAITRGNYRDSLRAIEVLSGLHGLNAPTVHEMHMIHDSLRREYENMFGRLKAKLEPGVFDAVIAALAEEDAGDLGLSGSGPENKGEPATIN